MSSGYASNVITPASPLAEGRELKYTYTLLYAECPESPLAEGRELKWKATKDKKTTRPSPLAEGRELKYVHRRSAGH